MLPVFQLISLMFIVGGSGLAAYALDAGKPTLAGLIGSFTLGAIIALA